MINNVVPIQLDPYCRDEMGKFVAKPKILPAPAAKAIDVSGGNRAVYVSYEGGGTAWRVRCVKRDNGTWRVICELS